MTPELSVLKDGTILRDEHGNVLDASASVVLVRSEGTVLLVDTAMPRDADTIRKALDDRGLGPEDVNVVVNTHGHIDHTGCNRLFTRATVAVHATEGAYRAGGWGRTRGARSHFLRGSDHMHLLPRVSAT